MRVVRGLGPFFGLFFCSSIPFAASAGDPILLCQGEDGLVRLATAEAGCAGEILKVQEWEPEIEDAPEPEENASDSAANDAIAQRIGALEARIEALEQAQNATKEPDPAIQQILTRLTGLEDHVAEKEAEYLREFSALDARVEKLESQPSGQNRLETRVKAPFAVVGPNGQPIFRVSDQTGSGARLVEVDNGQLDFYNGGTSVASLGVGGTSGAGGLVLNHADGSEAILAYGSRGQLEFLNGSTVVATVGTGETGAGTVQLNDTDGQLAAAVSAASRTIGIFDQNARAAAALYYNNGKPVVFVNNDIGKLIASMGQSDLGYGGAVQVFSATGEPAGFISAGSEGDGAMVLHNAAGNRTILASARLKVIGVTDDSDALVSALTREGNNGVVAIYNGQGNPVAALTRSDNGQGGNVKTLNDGGMDAASMGAASDGGGEVCVNRINGAGQRKLECLGVGLPGMGQGK